MWYSDKAPTIEKKYSKSILRYFKVGSHIGMTINPYQGCHHRCGYCYATYKWSPDFYDKIYGKINAPEILESELNKWKNISLLPVMISSATDAYQFAEAKFGITKKCIQVLQQFQIPFYVFTKSCLIERDLNLFSNYSTRCFVVWSITTLDEKIKRIIEPGTPPSKRVFETIKKFLDSGINCCINIDPIIPFVTDNEEQIRSIIDLCHQFGLKYISGSILRLRDDIWVRIRDILELLGVSWSIEEYERIFGFQEAIINDNNLSAITTYSDKVMNGLKNELSKRNIEFGFDKLIELISNKKSGYAISTKQCRISEFV
ncbi:MAG TPA: radical SAM protein [Nitrososphaeraceae archaeon]|nr:radical SAM protein [Nitrososphaeraceae archaeon]